MHRLWLSMTMCFAVMGLTAVATPALGAPPGGDFQMQVTMSQGRIGAQIQGMTRELRAFFGAPKDAGVLVTRVKADSPAEKAGLEVGDVIVKVGDRRIEDPWHVAPALVAKNDDDPTKIRVVRNKKRVTLRVALAAKPQGWHGFSKKNFDIRGDWNFGFSVPDPDEFAKRLKERFKSFGDSPATKRSLQRELERLRERLREFKRQLDQLETDDQGPT